MYLFRLPALQTSYPMPSGHIYAKRGRLAATLRLLPVHMPAHGCSELYGALDSPSTMRALASLFEHDVEFELIPVDFQAGELKKMPSLSPFGELPVFQEGDLTLFESRTIMRYISHEYGKRGEEQVYEIPKLQGIAAAWIDVEDHQFDPPASKLIWELVFKPQKGLPTDEGVVEEEEAKLVKVLDVYEERLSNSVFLGGD
ncbi:Glutathione S-transferase [Vitis vinifera]|uniref:glutathione transferase n=1 Tax=Vitis vinifera TaxID=29760 RepID=A0A438KHW7_VITVI|nr:Glutathione S-transferase [Vitis vinifera]